MEGYRLFLHALRNTAMHHLPIEGYNHFRCMVIVQG